MKKITQKKRRRSFTPKHKYIVLAVFLAVVFGASWYGISKLQHHHAVEQQRAQFVQADRDLNTIITDIRDSSSLTDSLEKHSCAYSNRDYARGILGCAISGYMAYGINSGDEAYHLSQRLDSIINNQRVWKHKGLFSVKPELIKPADQFASEDYIDSVSGLSCTASYTYYLKTPPDGYPPLKLLNYQYGLLTELVCGGPAKAAYYPVVN